MAVFKCKMCGGELAIEAGSTVAECEYCGAKQTLPKLDDERRANLYDRANHFRRNNEFDKAAGIYEQILNEDTTDAEAYWSLVLCRYGIEYVEDPATHKRVPTINRTQYTSIFADEDYKSAVEYADAAQQAIYEDEAKAIDEIQKGILAISQKEEPFDVFICYKETDNNGRRTPDSVLANDLYHQLTQEGFKVFFARITLEDKLGMEYEPYIFSALNSAKIMVVLGTKPEYFNAVWVKNEWSRYLALVKESGGKKMLIPAYKDMDPYDLPEEFSHLQAQDMSRLGFMQDLIRGIKKLTGTDEAPAAQPVVVQPAAPTAVAASVSLLIKRAFIFLEDGEWEKADDFCEQVLNQDPESAEAYLGKLMAERKVPKREQLGEQKTPFDSSKNYKKADRFGDAALKAELHSAVAKINERIAKEKAAEELRRKGESYKKAVSMMETASTQIAYSEAADQFKKLSGFRDSDELAKQCTEKMESCRKDRIYAQAASKMQGDFDSSGYEAAIAQFSQIPGWKDADEQIETCKRKIEEIKERKEKERIEAERKAEEQRIARRKAAKKTRKIALLSAAAIAVFVVAMIVLQTVIIPNDKYNAALAAYHAGEYNEALTALKALGEYKDSPEKVKEVYEAFKRYQAERIKTASAGEYVYFGTYEQDNDLSNGKEDIEWLVLAKEDNKLLVISKYALDCRSFNTTGGQVTWESSSLRKWLNGAFLDNAFNAEEQSKILDSVVTADDNSQNSTVPRNDTTDKVFLLSVQEFKEYYGSDKAGKCVPTRYACELGAWTGDINKVDGKVTCWWWLRSQGNSSSFAARVESAGSVDSNGQFVMLKSGGVRPAMWIDLGE